MEIDLDDPSTWPTGEFTCHNEGCENNGIPIRMQVPEDPTTHTVYCGGSRFEQTDGGPIAAGPCLTEITDKKLAK